MEKSRHILITDNGAERIEIATQDNFYALIHRVKGELPKVIILNSREMDAIRDFISKETNQRKI